MNLHFSFKSAKTPDIEKEIANHVRKLEGLLHAFRPDLVHLHGTMESGKLGATQVSLNLRLPTGQISARDSADSAAQTVKVAFSDLMGQLKRHKEMLRSEHKWRRHHIGKQGPLAEIEDAVKEVPVRGRRMDGHSHRDERWQADPEFAEQTFEENQTLFQADVRQYLNANLKRLERYIERELRFLEVAGLIEPGLVTPEEVVDEVVVTALSMEQKPAHATLERWLYRTAVKAIRRVADGNHENHESLPLEQSVWGRNVSGSDEAFLQYHQPGEELHREDVIADVHAVSPEEIAASDELVEQLDRALRTSRPSEREAFILFTVEGFTVEEICQVTERGAQEVKHLIAAAREQVLKRLPAGDSLRNRLAHPQHGAA